MNQRAAFVPVEDGGGLPVEPLSADAGVGGNAAERPSIACDGRQLIGSILIEQGLIVPGDVNRVLAAQDQQPSRFGEAACRLGMLTPEQVRRALARQLRTASIATKPPSDQLATLTRPDSPFAEAVKALRGQLMIQGVAGAFGHKQSLAVVGLERGEGRSLLAANLAIAFAQGGHQVLLVDADLRHPKQHELFGLSNDAGLSAVMSGQSAVRTLERGEVSGLALLTAGTCTADPQYLMSDGRLGRLLLELESIYDLIVVDTPAAAHFAESLIVARDIGRALVVSRLNRGDIGAIKRLGGNLRTAGVEIAGSTLSRF